MSAKRLTVFAGGPCALVLPAWSPALPLPKSAKVGESPSSPALWLLETGVERVYLLPSLQIIDFHNISIHLGIK